MLDADTRETDTSLLEKADLSKIRTPAFVFAAEAVETRILALKEVLGTKCIISFKASNQQDIVSRLSPAAFDGIEVASRGELHMCAGLKSRHFYVNTPALTEALARGTIGAKARFIVDCPRHLDMIVLLRGARTVEPLTLRLSNRLIAAFSPEAPRLRDDQFGMDMTLLTEAIAKCRDLGFAVEGLHLYAGPHTFGKAALHVAAAMKAIVPKVEAMLGHKLSVLNLGGGLEENWRDRGHDFASYRAAIAGLQAEYEVIHEFGRAIFSDCGLFATRVLQVKEVCGQNYAVCDGGMAQAFLLAQTENMMRKYRTPRIYGREAEPLAEGRMTIVVGSTCSRDDVIGHIPFRLKEGDLLTFSDCGAYTRTYSMNNFLQLGEATSYVL